MMSMVHLSGDMGWVRGPIRPGPPGLNGVQGDLSEADQATVRAAALEVIKDYRDRGSTLPPPPSVDDVLEMMSVLVGAPVAADHAEMIFEDLLQRRHDPGGPELVSTPEDRAAFKVCVIGCGESGLLAGIRLSRAGIPFTILEKNAGVGGTWFENSYPGARVDIANHFYSYSFEPRAWTHFYAEQPEIHAYLEDVMDHHGIEPHVQFSCTVESATWDDDRATLDRRVHRRRRRARDDRGERGDLRGRAAQSAVDPRPARRRDVRWSRVPQRRVGTTTWSSPARTSRSSGPARAGSRSRPRSRTRCDRSPSTSAPRSGSLRTRSTTSRSATASRGRWSTCRTTTVGTGRSSRTRSPTARPCSTRIDPEWDGGNESVSEMNVLTREFFLATYEDHVTTRSSSRS